MPGIGMAIIDGIVRVGRIRNTPPAEKLPEFFQRNRSQSPRDRCHKKGFLEMLIRSFQITNYKCFAKTAQHRLFPGFNVVVGVNNVGKSALLEALSLAFEPRPYRRARQSRLSAVDPSSLIHLTISVTGSELKDALLRKVAPHIPVTDEQSTKSRARASLEALINSPNLEFSFKRDSEKNITDAMILNCSIFSEALDKYNKGFALEVHADDNEVVVTDASFGISNAVGTFCNSIAQHFSSYIYGFRAERLKVGECGRGVSPVLKPDAANLPEVFHALQTRRPPRFAAFNECVRLSFPDVRFVNVRFHNDRTNNLEIVIWTTDTPEERDDLAIPLAESGTGIGQVLATLYVVVSSDSPRCIAIDEPNSFLHPGAAKKLIQILRSYPQHQYIVSTHSPEIIRATDPDALIRLRRRDARSTIEIVPAGALDQQRELLVELGVSLSDVFGADNILWVEGPTERECFPRIRRKLCKASLLGTSIVPMYATGDFDRKRLPASTVFRLYTTLSQGNALTPPAIGFIFDSDRRSEREIVDLVRESGGAARFLKRRMYENYLLHTGALVAVMNSLTTFNSQELTESIVGDWFKRHGIDRMGVGCEASNDPLSDSNWIREVDGARLLHELFVELSDSKEKYEKITHGIALTDWLLSNAPNALSEVAELLTYGTQLDRKAQTEQ